MAGITFWLGMGLVVGVGFLSASDPVAEIDHFHPLANRLIGLGVIGALVAYFAWVARMRWRDAAAFGDFKLPGPRLTLGADGARRHRHLLGGGGALRSAAAGDSGSAFPTFATLYSFASMLGIASHAPGGLGVFEATILQGVGGSQDACWPRCCCFAASITPSLSCRDGDARRASRRCAAGVRCAKRCRAPADD